METMDNIISGKQKKTVVPKPGEFVVLSSDKKNAMQSEIGDGAIGLDEFLETSRKMGGSQAAPSISGTSMRGSRLKSARKQTIQSELPINPDDPNYQGRLHLPPLSKGSNGKTQSIGGYGKKDRIDQEFVSDDDSHDFIQIAGKSFASGVSEGLAESHFAEGRNDPMRQSQQYIADNDEVRTSMTTSIRNIMRKQEKTMLSSASRLLNSQLQEKQKQLSRGYSQASFHGGANHISNMSYAQQAQTEIGSESRTQKSLSRPSSAYLFVGQSKELLKQNKDRLSIKGARKRDPQQKKSHTYSKNRPKAPSLARPVQSVKKTPSKAQQMLPELVQRQQQYTKGKVKASPFMTETPVQKIVIKEETPKILGKADPLPGPPKEEVLEMRMTNNYEDIKELEDKISPQKQDEAGKGKIIGKARKSEMNSKKFLPVDSYDPNFDLENPLQMIEDHRDQRTGLCIGKSKWFYANGEYEMKDCEILGYDKKTERYQIKWVGKDNQKQVSRLNLIFRGENHEDFMKRIEEAKHYREKAELIMKYNYLIQNTNIRPIEVSDNMKTRISSYILNYQNENPPKFQYRNPLEFLSLPAQERYDIPISKTKPKELKSDLSKLYGAMKDKDYNLSQLQDLFNEIDDDYSRAHQQIEFDTQLPYSTEKFEMLRQILPKEKFIPASERIIDEGEQKAVIDIPERMFPFKKLLQTMSVQLHQANPQKLHSLQKMNEKTINLTDHSFFETYYPMGPVAKDIYLKLNRSKGLDLIREVRNAMFDSQYEVVNMVQRELQRVKELNQQRRKAASYESKPFREEQLSPQFVNEMTQFQFLLNFVYERQIRECFENSYMNLISSYAYILKNIKLSLERDEVQDLGDEPIDLPNLLIIAQDPIFWKRMKNKQILKVDVIYNDKNKIHFSPPLQEWRDQIFQLVYNAGSEINNVPCFYANEIGYARESARIKVLEENDFFVEAKSNELNLILDQIFLFPQSFLNLIQEYAYLLDIDIKKYKRDYKQNDYPVEKYQAELKQYKLALDHIEEIMYDQNKLMFGPFEINCAKLRKQFLARLEDLNAVLFTCVKKKIIQNNKQIEEEVDKILAVIQKEPEDIEELTDMRNFIKDLKSKMDGVEKAIKEVMNKMSLLEEHQYYLQEDEFNQTWVSFSRPLDISRARWDCERRMKRDEKEFFEDLRQMTSQLADEFEDCKVEFEIIQNVESLNDHPKVSNQCEILLDRFERAIETSEIVNRREDLFKLRLTAYQDLIKCRNDFMSYYTMWNLAREYFYKIDVWMNGTLGDIDRDEITKEVNEACQTLMKAEKIDFREKRHTALIANELRTLYEQFKPYLPLICDLRNPGLKARHWDNVSEVTGIDLDGDLQTSLKELLNKGIMKFQEQINEVSDIATREAKLEEAIIKMRDEWRNVKFEVQEFRNSETYTLKQVEPIWELLDEHIVKTMAIASSPYIKFLASEVNSWKNTLLRIQEILEEWSKAQRGWLYLWPIFSSEDIQKQMPKLSQTFQTVDKIWRTLMLGTYQNTHVLDACSQHKIYEQFLQANDMIDKIQKGLNEYLNTKRMAFPRFFFLSNDDLLSILSQTKEPTRVQDHMNKCFEGIQELRFDDNKCIHGMYSALTEYVPFLDKINPFSEETPTEVRPVEEWLKEVEDQMKLSLKEVHELSKKDYNDDSREQWIKKWQGQAVLTVSQVIWTYNIELALQKKDLQSVFQLEQQKLLNLVEMIKQELSEIEVMTLGSMIVLDVHGKDVISDLIDSNITNAEQFEWISQLRYYMTYKQIKPTGAQSSRSGAPPTAPADDGDQIKEVMDIEVKMVNTVREYGFEYLGNQPRLVITPLTDRCYRTLMGALQLNLGGAPEGPAGTGKTETTKDLSKAIAKQCIVFNCSDQLDVAAMSKFFKGLACCGAWACFDEFNRIELEVLSVIASQILTIQNALMRRRAATPFQFEDTQIPLNPSCAVFITMNPGYAGRSDLPDNLKALFRPVAMMIPNYSMIAEILLYSFGFSQARELSIKITQSLRLSSEQLSTQGHYDYGMRAVKSIVMAAGGLKRELLHLDEAQIVLRAISDCNIPKFISEDIPLFEGIISDLFPTTEKDVPDYGLLTQCINEIIKQRNLEMNHEFMVKVIQLYETVQVRHGLMLVGETMSGKSQVMHTLAQSVSLRNEKRASGQFGEELSAGPSIAYEASKTEQSMISEKTGADGRATPSKANSVHGDELSTVEDKPKVSFPSVKINTINPKSISIGALYGDFDKITHDWTDGILAVTVRDCARDKSKNKRWITLDGPVDAVWVENLNTVLDDNKKLCLSSGEIIKFTPQMTMMFEVADLSEASPATVSRCGMVYMEPDRLGWQVLVPSWLRSLPYTLVQQDRDKIMKECMLTILGKSLDYVYSEEANMKFIVPVTKSWLAHSCIKLFESNLMGEDTYQDILNKEQELKDKEEARLAYLKLAGIAGDKAEKKDDKLTNDEKSMIFVNFWVSLIWSVGAVLKEESRPSYNIHLFDLIEQITQQSLLSFHDSIEKRVLLDYGKNHFDYTYDKERSCWLKWDTQIPQNFKIPEDSEFSDILIPTMDTARYSYLLQLLAHHSFPCLFVGETGTGKTQMMKRFVFDLHKEKWENGNMIFSATTSAQMVQQYLEKKVEKRKRGVYGPIVGKRLVIFIDDLNMPAKEQYGAQPPIEMIRQVMESGFYEFKNLTFCQIVDSVIIASMGTPGGGKSVLSKRLTRRFNMIHIPDFSDENLQKIFQTILEWGYDQQLDQIKKQIKNIIVSTISLYTKVSKELLPLPSKSHYTFNLRSISEVVQGMMNLNPKIVSQQEQKILYLQKLWTHECMRVFTDRLISYEDQNIVVELIKEAANESGMKVDWDRIQPQKIVFNSFNGFVPGKLDLVYDEIDPSSDLAIKQIEEILQFYNMQNKEKISLLIFEYVIQHLSRLTRIIKKPYGNALLIGIGGNGRKCLSKLAAFYAECQSFRIEISKNYGRLEWVDDMKTLYKSLGLDNKKVAFMFQDTDIKHESFIEDVNNILNTGEVPNLFPLDEREDIQYEMQKITVQKNADMFEVFLNRCKKNLHLFIFMSPAGETLRQYIRLYPSLVNCATIDWFMQWPDEALQKVGVHYLSDFEQDDEQRDKVVSLCVKAHQSIQSLSAQYLEEQHRHVYITPTRFLELLGTFKSIIHSKHNYIDTEIDKYEVGVKKLDEANTKIDAMKQQLENLRPILEEKTKQAESTLVKLEKETKEVEATKAIVEREEEQVLEQKAKAEGIKTECQQKLDMAMPMLNEAIEALRTLKINDFVQMKSYKSPPQLIVLALDAVCIMLGIQPKMIEQQVGKEKKKVPDYWEKSKKLLNDCKKFIQSLEKYDRDNIPEDRIEKIQEYLINPKFDPPIIRKASEAAEGICKWVIAICKYDVVAKDVRPRKAALNQATEELEVVTAQLREKQAQLQEIIDKKNALEEEFKAQNLEKQTLMSQIEECKVKLDRALRLTGGLGKERGRWLKSADRLRTDKTNLLGNVILSSAVITYLGPFNDHFRHRIIGKDWMTACLRVEINIDEDFTLEKTIGDQIEIQNWKLRSLPSDNVSVENMIIINHSPSKWPLLIDPQSQALKFLKVSHEKHVSIKLATEDYQKKLEAAIFMGEFVICEDVNENIDTGIMSVVGKETYEVNGDRYIKVNETQVDYNANFRFYMITSLSNPHFSPDIHTKTRILNFSITKNGLEQQLLSVVCRHESAKDEDERDKLTKQNADFKEKKREIENLILDQLRNSGEDILEDEKLIDSCNESKKITEDIKMKLKSAKAVEERIEENRNNYFPVAKYGTILFFCVSDLHLLDPMYQYSMKWFRDLFEKSFKVPPSSSEGGEETTRKKPTKERVRELVESFRQILYKNVCRSLFEKHKLMFSFLMSIKLNEEDIEQKELRYLLTSLAEDEVEETPNKAKSVIDEKQWKTLQELNQLDSFEGLTQHVNENPYDWKLFIENQVQPERKPTPINKEPSSRKISVANEDEIYNQDGIPGKFGQLNPFSKILLYKALKADQVVSQIRQYISWSLGDYFVTPPQFSLKEAFEDSNQKVPLIFILTPGNDPMSDLQKFSEEWGKFLTPISMGKGQGIKAKEAIIENMESGQWVILQNCHLAASWLPDLEILIEKISMLPQENNDKDEKGNKKKKEERFPNDVHPGFRLWLTSMPSSDFPTSVLQNGVKMTNEPPRGVKANLIRSFEMIKNSKVDTEFYNENPRPIQWKKLFMSLTYFHAIVRERNKYGSLGWNLRYDFNDSDYKISMRQLHLMIAQFNSIPYKALLYLTGECNYGGRVTDDWDRRTLITILNDFYTSKVFDDKDYEILPLAEYKLLQFEGSGVDPEKIKSGGDLEDYIEFVYTLPDQESPMLFGLHDNANITYAINESNAITQDILKMTSSSASGDSSSEQQFVRKLAQEFKQQIPEAFKIKDIEVKYPFTYEESMNTVLLQELSRFNRLIDIIKSSLVGLEKTLDGLQLMTNDMEQLLFAFKSNQVPKMWAARAYPSRKPLMSWVKDLQARLKMLQDWIDNGQPAVYWISGFFFTQSFLTGVKQNFARKYQYPIDEIDFEFEVLRDYKLVEGSKAPQDGCYIKGLFLDGAGWSLQDAHLIESEPKQLQTEMPIIYFRPVKLDKNSKQVSSQQIYHSPVYKTSARAGTLSTTGHSTNYILTLKLSSQCDESVWIKRSVALLTQLDD